MIEQYLSAIEQHPDYQVLKRVPATLEANVSVSASEPIFNATIIDLETMGMDANKDEIIEIGMLSFVFSNDKGILEIKDTYNELNDPGKPIPPEISKITGIFDKDVKGKSIDWDFVLKILTQSHLVLCHNSQFDRNFLELQTPENIQNRIKVLPFACTVKDINWKERGFESAKLDYLNWKLGFFMMVIEQLMIAGQH